MTRSVITSTVSLNLDENLVIDYYTSLANIKTGAHQRLRKLPRLYEANNLTTRAACRSRPCRDLVETLSLSKFKIRFFCILVTNLHYLHQARLPDVFVQIHGTRHGLWLRARCLCTSTLSSGSLSSGSLHQGTEDSHRSRSHLRKAYLPRAYKKPQNGKVRTNDG